MGIERRIARWLARRTPIIRRLVPETGKQRVPINHIVILDGTNSTLTAGYETNAGILYKLLRETTPSADINLHYEAGVPWDGWRGTLNVIVGRGINGQIKRAYGAIASSYEPGDRIFLFGFSRGAYAVRSLAGIIGQIGLLKDEYATERKVRDVFRHYENDPTSPAAQAFSEAYCQNDVTIEMIGVWDTVKSLGLRVPFMWRLTEERYKFHNHALGDYVANGFHALALDENRVSFSPVLWQMPSGFPGTIEQVWFRGVHGDIGGHLGGFNEARPKSNVALCWMLNKADQCGIRLPDGWHRRFEQDCFAPSLGRYRGLGFAYLSRRTRTVGTDPSELMHPTVVKIQEEQGIKAPDLPLAAVVNLDASDVEENGPEKA